jgi:tripartite-type tricarboxylate transporter receptor subunit TctC
MKALIEFLRPALWVIASFAALSAQAQPYPSRPIVLVVPYPAGGSADILARTVGQKLGERLGQPIVVENKAGAGTAIGAKAVAGAQPDGYTLLLGTVSSQAINPAMNKVGYDPLRDFAAVAPLASIPFVLVAHHSLPANSIAELIALSKSSPGQISYASAGVGTSNHLAGELLASAAQISLLHVPYKGSAPALNDVMAGHVPLMFDLLATALPAVQAGKLKALAVTGKSRTPLLPGVPTAIESGLKDFEVSAWFGVFAPAGTPAAIVDRLNAEITAELQLPEMQKRLRDLGADPETGTPESYSRYVRSEAGKWAEVVKKAGLSP